MAAIRTKHPTTYIITRAQIEATKATWRPYAGDLDWVAHAYYDGDGKAFRDLLMTKYRHPRRLDSNETLPSGNVVITFADTPCEACDKGLAHFP